MPEEDTGRRPRIILDDYVPMTAVSVRERAEHDARMRAATYGDESDDDGATS